MRRPPQYIVHPDRRFIYAFIPKVACSSIKTALAPLFDLKIPPGHGEVHRAFRHSGYQLARGEFIKGLRAGEYQGFSAAAFVRNPFDRLFSCYLQKLGPDASDTTGLRREYDEASLYQGMPFSEFVQAAHRIPDEAADPHFRSQHVSLLRPNGNFIPSFIGSFEALADDFPRFADELGVPEIELSHVNPSARGSSAGERTPAKRSYRDYYDAKTRELAQARYERDLDLFGYSF